MTQETNTESAKKSGPPNPEAVRSLPGYHTFDIEDYKQFSKVVHEHFADAREYVWRGHERADWRLESSLGRTLMAHPVHGASATANWPATAARHAEEHILNYLLRLGQVESLDLAYRELFDTLKTGKAANQSFLATLSHLPQAQVGMLFELFARAQHHWLKTPFLDWSQSPFVALHFAFEGEAGESDVGHRVVYALNRKLMTQLCVPHPFQARGVYFIESLAFGNRRITGQAGIFSYSPDYRPVEDAVVDLCQSEPDLPMLLRFRIRNIGRADCLNWLRTMNISRRALFPDLMGAALEANADLERDLNQSKK